VRYNEGGVLYTLVYDRVVASNLEPIEKKPFFHFMPGSLAYSVATVGCNQQCTFCQNWEIAQWPRDELPRRLAGDRGEAPIPLAALAIPGRSQSPEAIVNAALEAGASSIAYTFTEPTIYFELAYDTAVLARARGLKNLFVTNGYISEPALRKIATVLNAANIDLKFFRDASYRRISRASLQPVLDAIRLYHALGVWVEVTTLVIPGINDSDVELRQIAEFIRSVGAEVPWHVSQFSPAYEMVDRPATPAATLRRAREIGVHAGLRYVYEGNIPGEGYEHTVCPACHTVVIERFGFAVRWNRIKDGRCPACETWIEGVGMDGASPRQSAA
jgi:pyruvate formate lyase activating enzyme